MKSQYPILKKIDQAVTLLKKGQIGVIPTDTIYGLVGSALNSQTVEKIYQLRKRSTNKPMIILISDLNDLNHFNVSLTEKQIKFLNNIWPNPISVVLPCKEDKFNYLHRGTNSLAFRIPKDKWLIKILKKVGPLVAPSANYEGESPAKTVEEAKKYFGDKVDFYIDRGRVKALSSTIIEMKDDSVKVIRQGSFATFKKG